MRAAFCCADPTLSGKCRHQAQCCPPHFSVCLVCALSARAAAPDPSLFLQPTHRIAPNPAPTSGVGWAVRQHSTRPCVLLPQACRGASAHAMRCVHLKVSCGEPPPRGGVTPCHSCVPSLCVSRQELACVTAVTGKTKTRHGRCIVCMRCEELQLLLPAAPDGHGQMLYNPSHEGHAVLLSRASGRYADICGFSPTTSSPTITVKQNLW